ncbi:DUF4158 domain-containing protein [Streptomyces poriferorum]|uniref:DUF4158 domain-containing protein n=1 Tax=Streptomyces poriferorum TaxID=2798799 RepID=A0ABY9J2I7_9ACTN|nr:MULTISPECIES: DUF4158 domain-containing protein [unclassified Streptomyces]MDP5317370.1 DUF4158 domain-containing protein [Streptomyces sp. Alt4]WLQ62060.1 DUF4158 domain-containing protein [Streptomyces sp. Alt2]
MLLKFYTQYGRFPRNRAELPGEAVEFVARQVQVPASELDSYDWTGRTVEYHRAQIPEHLGFRECSVSNAEKLTAYLAGHAADKERRPEQVRVELLARCREESIEPPTPGRCDRIVGATLREAEESLTALISSRLTEESIERIMALVSGGADQDDDGPAGGAEGEDAPPGGRSQLRVDVEGDAAAPEELGRLAAADLLEMGAGYAGLKWRRTPQ